MGDDADRGLGSSTGVGVLLSGLRRVRRRTAGRSSNDRPSLFPLFPPFHLVAFPSLTSHLPQDYGPLLTPYDLYAKKPSHLSTVTSSTWLALTLSSSSPRMRFDLLPDSRRPTASAHLLQLDPSSLAPPTATQLQSYGRFFREWPFVEVVRDPAYAQRALADPPWWPRLTVWHEADPELDED